MKIYDTVKTEKRAIEILQEWLNEQMTEELMSTNTIIENTSVRCECGETQAMKAFYEGGELIATVGICDACGDDDAFIDDVLYVR